LRGESIEGAKFRRSGKGKAQWICNKAERRRTSRHCSDSLPAGGARSMSSVMNQNNSMLHQYWFLNRYFIGPASDLESIIRRRLRKTLSYFRITPEKKQRHFHLFSII
jgi:hypothetical protein